VDQVVSPVVIVGAGPTGIACAVELGRAGIAAECHDRGTLLETIYRFPEEMRWFSTRDLLEICGVPFAVPDAHPSRLQTLAYYRGVAEKFGVRVRPGSEIVRVRPSGDGLEVEGRRRDEPFRSFAPAAVIATGFFHNPLVLGVPGESLPLVEKRYISGFPFHDRDVVVVGGRNSASEAALDLYRHGARVTMVVRGPAISERVKYWIRPDLENRIRGGAIRAIFHCRVREILPAAVRVESPAGEETIPADAVFPLVGYAPDFALLERCGVALEGPERRPVHDLETLESNVSGLFLAGAVLSGTETGRIFIENSREHGARIARAISARRPAVPV
jgi:thioredoxin reductase (NADPH)